MSQESRNAGNSFEFTGEVPETAKSFSFSLRELRVVVVNQISVTLCPSGTFVIFV